MLILDLLGCPRSIPRTKVSSVPSGHGSLYPEVPPQVTRSRIDEANSTAVVLYGKQRATVVGKGAVIIFSSLETGRPAGRPARSARPPVQTGGVFDPSGGSLKESICMRAWITSQRGLLEVTSRADDRSRGRLAVMVTLGSSTSIPLTDRIQGRRSPLDTVPGPCWIPSPVQPWQKIEGLN